ncbi:hypothetical protein L9F63_012173, partial [Diploptera punctata]
CIQSVDLYQEAEYVLNEALESQNTMRQYVIQELQNKIENKFICQTCGASYKHKRNWTRHMKFECGLEPQYSCILCSKRFTRNSTLIRHVNTHHQFT